MMIRKVIILFLLLVCLANVTTVFTLSRAYAFLPPIQVGTDPNDTTPDNVDVSDLNYTNDATQFRFLIGLFAAPRTNPADTVRIYLNTISGQGATAGPPGYWAGADYYIVGDAIGAYLYKWNTVTSAWYQTAAIIIANYTSQVNTLVLTGTLSDIGYPWSNQQDMGVVVVTIVGRSVKDRAPDTGNWTITYAVIPEFPGITLPIFVAALVVTISLLYKYKYRAVLVNG